eukprot:931472-Heterocapsa_arctica.AAC.1
MRAIVGMLFQDGFTGSAWGGWALYTASWLRAFEYEHRVCAYIISYVPAAGWGQIFAYMAFGETSQDQSPGTGAATGDFGFK